jgi:hypothetical protein
MEHRVLEFDRDDVETAAAVLGRLALALLEQVFESGAGVAHDVWFGAPDVLVFDRAPARRIGWRRAVARLVPPLRTTVTGKGRWRGLGGSTPGRLRWSSDAVRARLALEYHGVEGLRIPDHLLALTGRMAWDAPAFRLAAAALVSAHFRSRLIAPPRGLPAPRVLPDVLWMIVATCPVPMPVAVRLGLAARGQRRALDRLRAFARTAMEDLALPADFWSHWIAWHVERRFGVPAELPPEWLSPLRAMDAVDGADPRGAMRRWQSPEALAASYAAWYPARARARQLILDAE